MGDVVDFFDRVPHLSGEAMCLVCKHHWAAVAVIGCFWLECPKCKCQRGVMKHHLSIANGEERWVCNSCECQIFQISKRGAFCMGCGLNTPWDAFG